MAKQGGLVLGQYSRFQLELRAARKRRRQARMFKFFSLRIRKQPAPVNFLRRVAARGGRITGHACDWDPEDM